MYKIQQNLTKLPPRGNGKLKLKTKLSDPIKSAANLPAYVEGPFKECM
jgi:hypothetical protein